MNMRRLIPILLIPLLLPGCETPPSRGDRQALREHNTPPGIYDKMTEDEPLSVDDIIVLSRRGVPADVINRYLGENYALYRLRIADIERMRAAGVSEAVISYMLYLAPPYGPIDSYQGAAYPQARPYRMQD
jgi:hypothetical protein